MSFKNTSFLNSPYRIEGLEERVYVMKEDEFSTVDPETGETFVMKRVDKSKKALHDGRRYTKLFVGGCDRFVGLSRSGYVVLIYIMGSIKPNRDTICVVDDDLSVWGGISKRSFGEAIVELLDREIIARRVGSRIEFFYDVNIFFNGDRRRLIKDRLSLQSKPYDKGV